MKNIADILAGKSLPTLLVFLFYPLAWVLLFKAAIILNVAPGVSVWFPPAGLTFAFLLRFPKAWPLAYLGVGYVVWEAPYATGAISIVLSALISPTVYIVGVGLLRRAIKGDFDLGQSTHIYGLIVASLLTPMFAASGNILNFCIDGIIPWSDCGPMIMRFFIGDALGVVAVAPTLLLLGRPWRIYFRRYPGWTLCLGLLATVAILYLEMVEATLGREQRGFSYFVLLPIAWSTVAFGSLGASLSSLLANISVSVAAIIDHERPVLAGAPYFMLSVGYFSLIVASMVENLQTAERRIRQQGTRLDKASYHFATLDTAARLAHEVKQPLASASAYVQFLRDSQQGGALNEKDLATVTQRIAQELKRLRRIIADDQRQDGFSGAERKVFSLSRALADVLPLLRQLALDHEARINIDIDRCAALVSGNQTFLQQLAVNLVRNACEAMSQTPANRRALSFQAFDDGERAVLRVTDNGEGFPDDVLEKGHGLFHSDKFGGAGFGLSIAQAILSKHDGGMEIANTGHGACVTCWMPRIVGRKDER